MKYLAAFLLTFVLMTQGVYAFTDSLHLVGASTQMADITNAAQTGLGFTGNLTLEMWVKVNNAPTSGQSMGLMSKQDGPDNENSYYWYYGNSGGTLLFGFHTSATGATNNAATITYTLTPGTWYQIAAVYTTAGSWTLYVNGVSQGTATGLDTNIFNGTAYFVVGGYYDPADSYFGAFDGQIFLARAWNTNLSGATILANECTNLGATTNLKGEWQFNNAYTDDSGNSNTLTGINSPTFTASIPAACASAAAATNSYHRIFWW